MTKLNRDNIDGKNPDIKDKISDYSLDSIAVKNNSKAIYSNHTKYSKKYDEKTIVVYGKKKTTKLILKALHNSKNRWDNYTNSEGPTIAMGVSPLQKGIEKAYERGVKLRYISEITKHNIQYCKELMKIVELRHLEGAKGGMAVNETEYIATAHLHEAKPLMHLIYSNVKEIVEQQQFVFESFWSRAVPAEQKIREIEEGTELVRTIVLENQSDIYNHLINTIRKSNACYVCFSIGGMRMIYNNFFNSFKEIIKRQKIGEERERKEPYGIKWLTHIDDDEKDIELVKVFLNAGIQLKHIRNLPSINFLVDTNSIQATIERMDDGKIMKDLLVSNEPAYIKHFMSFFQDLWTNSGIDALERIKSIEEGLEYDNQIIRHSDRAFDSYLDIVKMAQSEILFIFPTPKAFIRQLKAIYWAIQVSKERKAKVRILTPSNELVEKSIKLLLKGKGKEEEENEKEEEDTNQSITSYSKNDGYIKIRFIEKMSNTKATIVVVDRKESLIMELKDDTKDTFIEAIGLSTYSNSKPAVFSYIAIFENLWKQSELYQQLKDANEKLKVQDMMQKDFINIAVHELRNPIQPIIGLTQFLKNKTTDKKQHEMFDIIDRNAKRLLKLSEDVLDISRIESHSLSLNKENFNLNEMIQNIISEITNQINKNNWQQQQQQQQQLQQQQLHKDTLKIESLLKDDIIMYADRSRINQVISNLLDNAIKFTKEKEEETDGNIITITVEKDSSSNYVIVSIRDTGKGIDSEILPRLFTKFVTKPGSGGTGLGLFISKSIIEAHGGTIWAYNNKEGKGATFGFSLPLIIME